MTKKPRAEDVAAVDYHAQVRLLHTPRLAMLNPNAVQLPGSTRFPGDFPQVRT